TGLSCIATRGTTKRRDYQRHRHSGSTRELGISRFSGAQFAHHSSMRSLSSGAHSRDPLASARNDSPNAGFSAPYPIFDLRLVKYIVSRHSGSMMLPRKMHIKSYSFQY